MSLVKRANWNGKIIAEADEEAVLNIEGNTYFPMKTTKSKFFKRTDHHTTCPWKGEAAYFDITVDGETNENAAWFYTAPKPDAITKVGKDFTNYVSFWNGVEITEAEIK